VSKLGVPAPKARNVTAWAIGPGWGSCRIQALKARNNGSAYQSVLSSVQRFYFAPSALSKSDLTLTWGVAPGYYISRRWRGGLRFDTASQSVGLRWKDIKVRETDGW